MQVEAAFRYLPVARHGTQQAYRWQRTTIFVPAGTIAPGAGACSRAVPLPVIWTSRPAWPASSITCRTESPSSDGTRNWPPSLTTTLLAAADDVDCVLCEAGCAGREVELPDCM